MLGETLVEERVIRINQLDEAAVFAHEMAEEHLGFLAQEAAQVAVEFDLLAVLKTAAERAAQRFQFLSFFRREFVF
jgi:hypothetical protein